MAISKNNSNNNWKTSKLPDGTLLLKEYIGDEEEVTIPSTLKGKKVSVIGTRALSKKVGKIKKIFIEDGIKIIESSIMVPILPIEHALESIRIPDSIIEIKGSIVIGTKNVEIICNPNTYADYYATKYNYKNCRENELLLYSPEPNLKEVIIDDKFYKLQNRAFMNCKDLKKVVLSKNLYEIAENSQVRADGPFNECELLKTAGPIGSNCDIEYKWTEYIPDSAFYGSNIESVIISSDIYSIGDYAFYGCNDNLKVYVSGYFRVGKKSFPDDAQIYLENENCPIDPSIKHLVITEKK